jgi:hypothetical protein
LKNLRRSCTHLRKDYLLLYLNFIIRLQNKWFNFTMFRLLTEYDLMVRFCTRK